MNNTYGIFFVAAVGLVVVLGCGKLTELANKGVNSPSNSTSKTFTLEGKEWKSHDLDQTDFKVELPGDPADKTPGESQMPPGYKQVFSSMRIWSYDEKDFGSGFTELRPTGKKTWKIKDLADTSMTAMKRQLPDVTYTLDIKSETNARINGAFTKNGKSFDLRGCEVYKKGKDARVWAVLTFYPKDNADGQTAAQRIIESVAFKESSEDCK